MTHKGPCYLDRSGLMNPDYKIQFPDRDARRGYRDRNDLMALVRTCLQVYAEATAFFNAENQFLDYSGSAWSFAKLLKKIPAQRLPLINHICRDVTDFRTPQRMKKHCLDSDAGILRIYYTVLEGEGVRLEEKVLRVCDGEIGIPFTGNEQCYSLVELENMLREMDSKNE